MEEESLETESHNCVLTFNGSKIYTPEPLFERYEKERKVEVRSPPNLISGRGRGGGENKNLFLIVFFLTLSVSCVSITPTRLGVSCCISFFFPLITVKGHTSGPFLS